MIIMLPLLILLLLFFTYFLFDFQCCLAQDERNMQTSLCLPFLFQLLFCAAEKVTMTRLA